MRVIGLTGGIGTGKSQVCRILRRLGASVVNADALGHQAYRPKTETWHRVVAAFGPGVAGPGGEINRRALGRIVFSDPGAAAKLNAIVWPRIADLARERIADLRKEGAATIVLEAAMLLEAGWDSLVDRVWVVRAPPEAVADRLRRRDGLSGAQIAARVAAQMPFEERAKRADNIIDNSSSLEQLEAMVKSLWKSHKEGSVEKHG